MGKNNNKKKDGKRKDQSVFKVAGSKVQKSKNKAKPVTTNLKKMNQSTKAKTEKVDATLKDLQAVMSQKPNIKPAPKKNPRPAKVVPEPVDVDAAMEGLSNL